MSGKAIIIPGCNFQNASLGTVTVQQDSGGQEVALQSISIEQSGSYTGRKLTMSVTYQPFNTTQIGVTWSIVSGGSYASITPSGVLTIDSTANASQVTVQATSTVNSSITATTTLVLTYDTDAKCNISWLLAPNTSSSVGDTQINAGETLTFTLSPDANHTIGDFKIMMGDTNISKQCTVTFSSEVLFYRRSFTITTPIITDDLIITNECHKLIQWKGSNMYCSRIIYQNNAYKTTSTNNFIHYGGIVPVTKDDVIRCYVAPTGDSTYNDYKWRVWYHELNTTDWSLLNHPAGYDVSQYVVQGGSVKQAVIASDTFVSAVSPITIEANNTVGAYIDLSAQTPTNANSAMTANTNFTTAFSSSSVPNGIGKCLKDISNIISGSTLFGLMTINETILEGGYFEDYNYGITDIASI